MKIVLLAAVSEDGFIAQPDGDSDWTKDDEVFDKTVQDFGCVVLGHRTYEQFRDEIYPIDGVQHLVLSHDAGEDVEHPNVHYVSDPEKAVQKAKDLGFDKLLVIGGGQCNGSFAEAGLLDEVWLDEHPLKLGKGIKLYSDHKVEPKLKKISSEKHDDFIQTKYEVINA